jgi:hypothetical protein
MFLIGAQFLCSAQKAAISGGCIFKLEGSRAFLSREGQETRHLRNNLVLLEPITYLITLAAMAVSFVGFSSLVLTFRQCGGGKLSRFDAFLMRTFIQLGFLVAASSLIPPLLSLSPLSTSEVWQLASLGSAAPSGLYAVTYPYRRQIASNQRTPLTIWVAAAVLSGSSLLLLVNATGLLFRPNAFAFSVSQTITLWLAGWGYLQALKMLVRDHLLQSSTQP